MAIAERVIDHQVRTFVGTRFGFFAIALIILMGVLGIAISNMTRDVAFDSARWKGQRTHRSRMATDSIESGRLIGMRRMEVENLLGSPDSVVSRRPQSQAQLLYWVDTAGIDDLWLEVVLDESEAVSTILRPD